MGCDIHAYAERKTANGWERIMAELPDGRDYESFAKMADVRNRFGIAPIDQPRGLPADTSIKDTMDELEYSDPLRVWLGDHSHSWLLLSELLAVNWNETTQMSGLVKGEEMAKFVRDHNARPSSFCQGVSGHGAGEYERVEWTEPLYKLCRTMAEMTLMLLPFAEGKPESVRIVFGFDS